MLASALPRQLQTLRLDDVAVGRTERQINPEFNSTISGKQYLVLTTAVTTREEVLQFGMDEKIMKRNVVIGGPRATPNAKLGLFCLTPTPKPIAQGECPPDSLKGVAKFAATCVAALSAQGLTVGNMLKGELEQKIGSVYHCTTEVKAEPTS